VAFHPYLMFGGNCRQAFTRYQEVLGGELRMMTMADAPADEGEVPAEQADLIMHAALEVDGHLLMGSDDPTGGFDGVRGVSVSYSTTDVAQANRVFDQLADGGEVSMPMSATFWSPAFGMCVDRFGIPWMVDADSQTEQPSTGTA
jgi:PhnB protein